MKLKIKLGFIALLSIFTIGCSKDIVTQENDIADEATKQKMMTKVQNDVNEIMNKDYEYILKNMGTPYCITYYIDKDKIVNLDKINENSNMRLVYPKYISNSKLEGSALYIDLTEDRVKEVQTYEFDNERMQKENIAEDVDIKLDIYLNKGIVDKSEIEDINFNEYIGKNKDSIHEVINSKFANMNIYSKLNGENTEVYLIQDKNGNIDNVLIVKLYEAKIKDIEVIDKDKTIDIVKSYIYSF